MTLQDFITLRDKCVEEFDAKLAKECKEPVIAIACREAFRQGFEAAYCQSTRPDTNSYSVLERYSHTKP